MAFLAFQPEHMAGIDRIPAEQAPLKR